MKRHEFFSTLGISAISAGLIFMAPVVTSCSKTMTTGGGGGSPVDFTLDLTLPANSALNNNGGSVVQDNVIVARTASGVYIALTSICTHQQYNPIQFDSANNRFHCPNHGSNFATDGSVINGPATSALTRYNTQLNGTSLRVYA
jgi:cytochrome b6-f complex iron-sulfur subunit